MVSFCISVFAKLILHDKDYIVIWVNISRLFFFYLQQIQAMIIPQLLFYWKAVGNQLKCFNYTINAAAASLAVDNNMKALAFVKEAEEMVFKQEKSGYANFVITDEERARIESLKGQVVNFIKI